MSFEESRKASIRCAEAHYYEEQLEACQRRLQGTHNKRTIIKPELMPWEHSRQGIIKHLINEKMDDVQIATLDVYMQLIPPGSRSGKHRHMSEEYIFVLEGAGYDLHWDVDYDVRDRYHWTVTEEPSRWEWEQGDSIYIPPNTVHQHFNAQPDRPARLICATSRLVRHIGFDDLEQIEDAPEYNQGQDPKRGGA